MFRNHIFNICMKKNLTRNDLQWLICHKTLPNLYPMPPSGFFHRLYDSSNRPHFLVDPVIPILVNTQQTLNNSLLLAHIKFANPCFLIILPLPVFGELELISFLQNLVHNHLLDYIWEDDNAVCMIWSEYLLEWFLWHGNLSRVISCNCKFIFTIFCVVVSYEICFSHSPIE